MHVRRRTATHALFVSDRRYAAMQAPIERSVQPAMHCKCVPATPAALIFRVDDRSRRVLRHGTAEWRRVVMWLPGGEQDNSEMRG